MATSTKDKNLQLDRVLIHLLAWRREVSETLIPPRDFGAAELEAQEFQLESRDRSRKLQLLELREVTLLQIEEALERVRAGLYGSCAECGGAIRGSRLTALPTTALCLACQSRREGDGRHAWALAPGSPS